ncbi:MAG: hypothetical protein ACTHXA_14335 [Gulosibacter sp.]|uniref:hypothetical protein n=1 Tax=Gulosibacter sp. TaxID=2817531 RepID=UPI003F907861
MSNSFEPETNPNVPWQQRGGFTTVAVISLVLGAVALLALLAGAIFGEQQLARGFVPYPAGVGLLFGILGLLGPWKWIAGLGAAANLTAIMIAMFIPSG